MKKIVRYLLEGNGTIPAFIEDGGYFASGEELVGVSIDTSKRHLPATVHVLTKQNIIDRLVAIGYKETPNDDPMDATAAATFVDQWLSDKGMADYS